MSVTCRRVFLALSALQSKLITFVTLTFETFVKLLYKTNFLFTHKHKLLNQVTYLSSRATPVGDLCSLHACRSENTARMRLMDTSVNIYRSFELSAVQIKALTVACSEGFVVELHNHHRSFSDENRFTFI